MTLSFVTDIIERRGDTIRQSFGNKLICFDEINGKRFQKFISAIHNEPEIKKLISRDFIDSKAWKWLFKTKSECKAENSFCSYMLSEMESSIVTSKFHFPIVYLTLQVPFKIGKVEFGYFTSEYFDGYIQGFSEHQPDKENPYVGMRKSYKGLVYAAATVSAEKKKTEEMALEICSLSLDMLKICSNTLDYPFVKMDFDIDRRSNYNPQSEVIVESVDQIKGLTTNLRRPAHPYLLDDFQFEYIKKRKLDVLHNFILKLGNDESELEKLIIKGIERFAKALSNANYYQRIAELFTILESLLLLSEDSPIIDTVCRYASKLITGDKEIRKRIIQLLKDMYKVRSGWVHHAKEKEFQTSDLTSLQKIVHDLLIALINKAKTHKVKQTLLEEIDDAILGAY